MRKTLIVLLIAIAACLAGYFFGVEAGGFINSIRYPHLNRLTPTQKLFLLEKMETIEIGSKLPNYFFHNSEGEYIELHKLITSKCLLTFISSECEACLVQLDAFSNLPKNSNVGCSIILISDSSPFDLKELKEKYDLKFQILYDHANEFGGHLNITTFPFSFLVDSEMIIIEMYPNKLFETELKEVMN